MLLLDSILAKDPAAKKASRDRAERIWKNTIRDAGPAGLTSPACCHIMREDAPFYTGHIEAAIKRMQQGAQCGRPSTIEVAPYDRAVMLSTRHRYIENPQPLAQRFELGTLLILLAIARPDVEAQHIVV